jgi:hypothetical protein
MTRGRTVRLLVGRDLPTSPNEGMLSDRDQAPKNLSRRFLDSCRQGKSEVATVLYVHVVEALAGAPRQAKPRVSRVASQGK